jgi:hypothetical protein
MIDPAPAVHHWVWWHTLVSVAGSGMAFRILNEIVKAMPPLPENAGWWARWLYGAIQGITGLNASTTTKPNVPPDAAPSEAKP